MTAGKHGYDVIVVGAGNAGLSAAAAAVELGARVLVLEKAPRELRGGNTYFTSIMRFPYDKVEHLVPLMRAPSAAEIKTLHERVLPYPEAEFYDDLMRVTAGRADPDLAEVLTTRAYDTVQWMANKGHDWVLTRWDPRMQPRQRPLSPNGGGAGLSDRWFAVAEKAGVRVTYDAEATRLLRDARGRVTGVTVRTNGQSADIATRCVVLACGGFEASPEMRARYLGPGWDLVHVRGVRFNTGDGHRMALDIGAQPEGHWSGCHATPQDLNMPKFGSRVGLSETSRYDYPWGIMVNTRGQRFIDEGEDIRTYTYAKTGGAIQAQPLGIAFQIFDRKVERLLIDSLRNVTGCVKNTIDEIAVDLGIEREGLGRTIREFNASVQEGKFDEFARDGKGTRGISPPKSNWALPIDTPPYRAVVVRCGITFTFGGLRIDPRAQVMDTSDRPIPGLYAAGEIAGGIFYHNYPGGSGLMSGSVFGRIAGTSAARAALA